MKDQRKSRLLLLLVITFVNKYHKLNVVLAMIKKLATSLI